MKKKGMDLIFGFVCGKVTHNLRIHPEDYGGNRRLTDGANDADGEQQGEAVAVKAQHALGCNREDAASQTQPYKARKDDCGAVIFLLCMRI